MVYTMGVDETVRVPLDPRWGAKRSYVGGGKFLVRNIHREQEVVRTLFDAGVRWYSQLPDVVELVQRNPAIATVANDERPKRKKDRAAQLRTPADDGPVFDRVVKPGRVVVHPEGWGEVVGREAVELWVDHVPRWKSDGWEVEAATHDVWNLDPLRAALHVRVDGQTMLVEGQLTVGRVMLSPHDLRFALSRGHKWAYHRGRAVPLPQRADLGFLADAAEKQVAVQLGDSGKIAPLLQGVLDASVAEGCKLIIQALIAATGPVQPSPHLTATLRDYQVYGMRWLQSHYDAGMGCLLADSMGVGKTVQCLAMLANVYDASSGKLRALVVCPTSLIANWSNEIVKFTKHFHVLRWEGTNRKVNETRLGDYNIVLTSYQTLLRDNVAFQQIPWDIAILDEAQQVKNSDSKTWAEVCALKPRRRLAITGTPIENNLGELYAIMEFAVPGLLGTQEQFEEAFVEPIKNEDREAMMRLRQLVSPFILRRTKEEVAHDLPDKEIIDYMCPMTLPQKQAYDAMFEDYRQQLRTALSVDRGRFFALMLAATTRLRQMATDPRLSPQGAQFRADHSGKMVAFRTLAGKKIAAGSKVLVFSQWTEMLSLLKQEAERCKWSYCYLDGSTKDRQAEVDRFQNTPEVKVFFISLNAGGVGLNLTAADTVIIVDPWWNPAKEAQAMDRAHRIGQKQNVYVYRLLAEDTIEANIATMQANKAFLASSVLDADMPDEQVAQNRNSEIQRLFGLLD